ATSGGAALVVRPGIERPEQLKGKKIASPQLGNTQDVALRAWLKSNGLKTTPTGGGDVQVVPQENSQTLETFTAKAIDGAWVPEPWVSRLIVDAGAKVLVDEASLWPGGKFVTAHLVVRTEFLKKYPAAVKALVAAQVESSGYLNVNSTEARRLVNEAIGRLTGKKLADAVIEQAWTRLQFTNDPVASSLRSSAEHAAGLGLLDSVNLEGIYDLSALNQVLRDAGKPGVAA
ncbi:MAG: ABC transporter substrate-binding protein, partial [Actinomycetota bacterium]